MILQNTMKRLTLVFVVLTLFVPVAIGQEEKPVKKEPVKYSQNDRDTIAVYFVETQQKFEAVISGLSGAQLNFRPNENSWTVAQVAEHIVISETAIFTMIADGPLKAELNKNADVFRIRDIAVTLAVTNRGQKFNAPPAVQPQQKLTTVDQLLAGFKTARSGNIRFLKTTEADLRNQFAYNGLIGMIDAYQWFLFLNGHTERHLSQIAEIMADRNYPGRDASVNERVR